MKVDANDEGLIRVAGKKINEKLKLYRDQFGIDDKQDLLAMVAFDNLFEKLRLDTSEETTGDTALEKITYLNRLISEELG